MASFLELSHKVLPLFWKELKFGCPSDGLEIVLYFLLNLLASSHDVMILI